MKEHIYTIGPIEDCTLEHMTGWRREVNDYMEELGIPVFDPTRRMTFHDQMDGLTQDTYRNLNICKRIFKQDLQEVSNSRVVIADVRRSSGRGTGSSCEIMFSHMLNKIIILWADPEDPIHPFLEAMATEKHYNLKDAMQAAASYY